MSTLAELSEQIETSAVFVKWKQSHKQGFFYLAFAMFERINLSTYEMAYYSPKDKKATIFVYNNSVSIKGEDKTFGDSSPQPLNLSKVKLSIADAISNASDFQSKEYPKESPIKTIAMLQVLDKQPTWNITYFTVGFSTLNIKLDAVSGKVINHSLSKLFDFVK